MRKSVTASRGSKSRERRAVVTAANNEAAAKRTSAQQLRRLDAAGHVASRERKRLLLDARAREDQAVSSANAIARLQGRAS
jgi:hypothetical protein